MRHIPILKIKWPLPILLKRLTLISAVDDVLQMLDQRSLTYEPDTITAGLKLFGSNFLINTRLESICTYRSPGNERRFCSSVEIKRFRKYVDQIVMLPSPNGSAVSEVEFMFPRVSRKKFLSLGSKKSTPLALTGSWTFACIIVDAESVEEMTSTSTSVSRAKESIGVSNRTTSNETVPGFFRKKRADAKSIMHPKSRNGFNSSEDVEFSGEGSTKSIMHPKSRNVFNSSEDVEFSGEGSLTERIWILEGEKLIAQPSILSSQGSPRRIFLCFLLGCSVAMLACAGIAALYLSRSAQIRG